MDSHEVGYHEEEGQGKCDVVQRAALGAALVLDLVELCGHIGVVSGIHIVSLLISYGVSCRTSDFQTPDLCVDLCDLFFNELLAGLEVLHLQPDVRLQVQSRCVVLVPSLDQTADGKLLCLEAN